jgi:hypothetical protein
LRAEAAKGKGKGTVWPAFASWTRQVWSVRQESWIRTCWLGLLDLNWFWNVLRVGSQVKLEVSFYVLDLKLN